MTPVLPPSAVVFTPEAVASINRAYVKALGILGAEKKFDELRLALAERMMLLARNGETDERRLCRLSIAAILDRSLEREDPSAATGSLAAVR